MVTQRLRNRPLLICRNESLHDQKRVLPMLKRTRIQCNLVQIGSFNIGPHTFPRIKQDKFGGCCRSNDSYNCAAVALVLEVHTALDVNTSACN
jgi:hypothetical protein